jgi:L-rhamnose mutarotase
MSEDELTQGFRVRRFGMVIGLREESAQAYVALHAGSGIRDLLTAANIRNFNIFLQRLPDGHLYEFAYYEYVGNNYEADMATLAAHPRNREWLALCNPMQRPFPEATGWTEMQAIFLNP